VRRLPIEDSFDLHSFRPEDVVSALGEYLREAARRGLREVRVIHGKGRGVRRAQVVRWLRDCDLVEELSEAPPDRGGAGATIVRLRGGSPGPGQSDRIPTGGSSR
jgi:DNA-nicking Smr family endonuclease